MITEKGKAFIARNFGVNNCSVSEDEVSCTVYTKGEPSERVLNTPTIVFLLVTEIVDWVRTPTGRFTLDDLVAGNDGSYISMTNALDIEPYCIPGAAPPVTPVVTPPVVPLAVAKLPAPRNIRVTNLRSDYAYVEWDAVLECCSDPSEPREYCACEFGIMLNGVPGKKVFADPHPGRDCEELRPGTRYTLEIQTRSPPNIYKYKEPSDKVSFSFTTPAVTPAAVTPLKDFEITKALVGCGPSSCNVEIHIKNNTTHSPSVYIRLDVDGKPRVKRHTYIYKGLTKRESIYLPFTGLSDGTHTLTIAVGEVADTDTYTHTFTVGIPGIEPPITAKITKAEILTELKRKGAIDTAAISTVPGVDRWYMYYRKLNYHNANFEKVIEISNLQTRNPPTQVADIALAVNRTSVNELDREWVLALLRDLPYAAVAAAAVKVTSTSAIPLWYADETDVYAIPIEKKSQFDLGIAICDGRYEKNACWEQYPEKCVIYKSQITRYEGVVEKAIDTNGYRGRVRIDFTKRPYEMHVTITSYPSVPVAAAAVTPEAIKAWIVKNYGDGRRVTSEGWRKLNVAKMANTLATLPSGYSKADITEEVVLWAKDNPNWETKTICEWIQSTGVTRLTADHGLYIYNSAVGWTTLADRIYDKLSPKPSKPSAAILTEDNGLGVYDYAIGWKTIANRITGCSF